MSDSTGPNGSARPNEGERDSFNACNMDAVSRPEGSAKAGEIAALAKWSAYCAAGALIAAVVFLICMFPVAYSNLGEVCGMVAFFVCLILAVPATAAGAVSLVRIHRTTERCGGIRHGVFGLVVGLASVFLWSSVLLVALGRAKEEQRRAHCRSNLRKVGIALTMYAQDNGGWTPAIYSEALEAAHRAGLPGGSVVAFRGEDGHWKASGLGLLAEGGYLSTMGPNVLYCPSTSGEDPSWVDGFSYDADDWHTSGPGPADGDGVGELPGNPEVMVSSYVLRYNRRAQGGSYGWEDADITAIVSDFLPFTAPEIVNNNRDLYNVIVCSAAAVASFPDTNSLIREACKGVDSNDIERTVDEVVFGEYLDGVWW